VKVIDEGQTRRVGGSQTCCGGAELGGCAVALGAVTNSLQKRANKSACQASIIPVESLGAKYFGLCLSGGEAVWGTI